LRKHYGGGGGYSLGPLSTAGGVLASALRPGRGGAVRKAKVPEQLLKLWSFEASPFCRIVRERLSALELPYRVVNICTGDIGTVAAKKYDIEAWMPRENAYKEVVSCSNCTSYQAVRMNIRVRDKKDFESKQHIHTLNSTAVATSRVIRAILENCQQRDGSVEIPEVLRPCMNNRNFL